MPRKISAELRNWYFDSNGVLNGDIYNDLREDPCMDGNEVAIPNIYSLKKYPYGWIAATFSCEFELNNGYQYTEGQQTSMDSILKSVTEGARNARRGKLG